MLIFKHQTGLRQFLSLQTDSVGFVPTMGALHEGHLSLIRAAQVAHSLTVCSIFVNPTQFNNPEDFEKYPIQTSSDIEKLLEVGCDVLYLPSVQDIYPDGLTKLTFYDLGHLDTILEGKYRPGHYQGVCNVVDRLLDAVRPNTMYLGEKDFQQCMVLKKLNSLTNRTLQISMVPTKREANGLAMSSRNQRLSTQARRIAGNIYEQLNYFKDTQGKLTFDSARNKAVDALQSSGIEVEYIALADADTFELLFDYASSKNMVVLIAAYLEGVRLIDNLRL